MDISSKVKEIIEEPLKEIDLTVDEVEYVKEDGNYFLRVILDKNGIIDIEDCVNATHIIDPLLDNIEISESYILDVCSKEKGCE